MARVLDKKYEDAEIERRIVVNAGNVVHGDRENVFAGVLGPGGGEGDIDCPGAFIVANGRDLERDLNCIERGHIRASAAH